MDKKDLGRLHLGSNRGCVLEGVRQENVAYTFTKSVVLFERFAAARGA